MASIVLKVPVDENLKKHPPKFLEPPSKSIPKATKIRSDLFLLKSLEPARPRDRIALASKAENARR